MYKVSEGRAHFSPNVLIVENENGEVFIVENKNDQESQVSKILKTEKSPRKSRRKATIVVETEESLEDV